MNLKLDGDHIRVPGKSWTSTCCNPKTKRIEKNKKGNQQDTAQAFQNPSCLQHLLCLGEDNNAAPTNESLLCCSTPTEVRTQRLHLHLHAIPWRQYIGYTQPEMTSDAWLDFPDMLHCAGLRWVATQDFCLITERDASQGKKSNEKKKKVRCGRMIPLFF